MQEDNFQSLKTKAISGVFWKGMERICAQLVSTVVSIVHVWLMNLAYGSNYCKTYAFF